MSEPYLGEIRRFPYEQLPQGWLVCDGQSVSISQYSALFGIIGSAYGEATSSTFVLPNLQNSVVVGQNGTAGSLGTSVFVTGPAAAYQTVCFGIAYMGEYPD